MTGSARSTGGFTAAELRKQIRHAVDPDGDQLPLLDALAETDRNAWVQLLGTGTAAQWDELRSLQQNYQGLLASMQDALEVLVPRGWAPFQMNSAAAVDAIHLVRAGDRPKTGLGTQTDDGPTYTL